MNGMLEGLGYCIADKALFINSWQEWFEDNQETNTGAMTIFAGHWRKAGNFKQTFNRIQEAFLNDLYIISFDIGLAQDLILNGYNGRIIKNF